MWGILVFGGGEAFERPSTNMCRFCLTVSIDHGAADGDDEKTPEQSGKSYMLYSQRVAESLRSQNQLVQEFYHAYT
jgi:hypothetical protein